MRTLKTSAVRWFFVTSAVSGFHRRVARYLLLRDRWFRCNKLRLQEIIFPNIEKTIHKQRNARIARVTYRSARAHSLRGRIHEAGVFEWWKHFGHRPNAIYNFSSAPNHRK